MPEFKDHAIVDRAVGYAGGNATLFVYDEASNQFVRRSTNVKKENGDRAVGTQLAADHPGAGGAAPRRGLQGAGDAVRQDLHDGLFPDRRIRPERSIGILYVGIPDGAASRPCCRMPSRTWRSRPASPRCW